MEHPLVQFVFFALAIGLTMFSMDPVFLAVFAAAAWLWSWKLSGPSALRFDALMTLPILAVMTLVNGLFTHNGATVLFYLNDQRITLEAILYGAAASVLLSSVIVWFSCFQKVMTAERFIYLFGRVAPVLGLTVSMVFRFLPLLKSRYAQIVMGQRCMGRHREKGLIAKARQKVKEISILISWSLEASIETADSMEARGYGLKGRTSYHLFRFTRRDGLQMALLLALGLGGAVGCALGRTSIYYYPVVQWEPWDVWRIGTLACVAVLTGLPLLWEAAGEKPWKQYV